MKYTYPDTLSNDSFDLVSEPIFDLLFNNGEKERIEEGTLRVLSLFSGCGGMDLGMEGGFVCHRKSAKDASWIEKNIDSDWVLLKRNKGQRDRLLSRRKRQKYNLKSDRDTDQSPVPHLGY